MSSDQLRHELEYRSRWRTMSGTFSFELFVRYVYEIFLPHIYEKEILYQIVDKYKVHVSHPILVFLYDRCGIQIWWRMSCVFSEYKQNFMWVESVWIKMNFNRRNSFPPNVSVKNLYSHLVLTLFINIKYLSVCGIMV